MITVEEAGKIILAETKDYGAEITPVEHAAGRVLAENIKAGNNFDQVKVATADGIAISYEAINNGVSSFHIKGVQGIDVVSLSASETDHCIEIIAGSKLPAHTDTVIKYDELEIRAGIASPLVDHHAIKKGSNIHHLNVGGDGLVARIGDVITPEMIGSIASVGETELRVKKTPKIAVLSLNNSYNAHSINAILQQNRVDAIVPQLPKDIDSIKRSLGEYLQTYDVIILSGDNGPLHELLGEQYIEVLFNEVQQLPGRSFAFAKSVNGTMIFGLLNDMSSLTLCLYRYFLPWYFSTLGIADKPDIYAILSHDIHFQPELTYFLQVELILSDRGKLMAHPIPHQNGHSANAFMELPAGKHNFKKDELYKVYPISRII